MFEPKAVNPLQHTEFIRQFFGVCYVFSLAQVGKRGVFVEGGGFNPERQIGESPLIAKTIDSESKVAISVAAGDKQSLQAGSLYWLRRDAMSALVKIGLEVRLAGPFWEEGLVFRLKQLAHSFLQAVISGSIPRIHLARPSKFVSARRGNNFKYVGFVGDEIEFYRRSNLVLIIENDLGSLSEKLFSAICSGRQVIYAGASEAKGLPNLGSVFFAEPTVDSITNVVEHLMRQDKTVSQVDFRALQNRSFESFYNRLVSRVVNGN